MKLSVRKDPRFQYNTVLEIKDRAFYHAFNIQLIFLKKHQIYGTQIGFNCIPSKSLCHNL